MSGCKFMLTKADIAAVVLCYLHPLPDCAHLLSSFTLLHGNIRILCNKWIVPFYPKKVKKYYHKKYP